MKAIRVHQFGEPEVMTWEDVAPKTPADDQVLVEIKAAGVNPVDSYLRSGAYAYKPSLPFTPGFDAAGIVKAIGKKIKKFSIGDRVYTADSLTGTYAQEALCTEAQLFLLSKKLTFEQGAGIYVPYTTAYFGLFNRAKARQGESVLIHGASGAVGIAAVQLAKAAGLTILATVGSQKGQKLVKDQGADYVFDHHDPNYREKIKDIAQGKGVDIILEMLADVNLNHDIGLAALKGRIIVIGCRGPVEINPRGLMRQDSQIMGLSLFHLTPLEKTKIQQSLYRGFEKGELSPIIGEQYPFEKAAQAHHKVMSPGAYGKIVLKSP